MTAIVTRAFQLQMIDSMEFKRRYARVLQYCDSMDGVIWVDSQLKTIDPKGWDKDWKTLVNKQSAKLEAA